MFLTGQLFPRPWEQPKQTRQAKDKNYYNTQDNLWNNPHRSSKKISKYYHEPTQVFKCSFFNIIHTETHYSDQEITQMVSKEKEFMNYMQHQSQRLESVDRLNNRKMEREILQFKSNQPVKEDKVEQLGDLARNDPTLFDELALKKSNTFKDPEKTKQPNMQLWNLINQYPTKQIQKVVRPKILQMDQNACQNIMHKFEQEKQGEEMQKEWFRQNRSELRKKFLDRHERNIEMEKKSGVRKEYMTIARNQSEVGGNLLENNAISERFSASNQNYRPISAKMEPVTQFTSKRESQGQSKGATGRSFVQNQQVPIHKPGAMSEDQGTLTFRNKEGTQEEEKNQKYQQLHQNHVDTDLNYDGVPFVIQMGDEHFEFQGQPGKVLSDIQSLGDFRISTATKPLFYRTNKTIDKLNQPKKQYQPMQPYMHSDFRGLLNADYQEALMNCHFYDKTDQAGVEIYNDLSNSRRQSSSQTNRKSHSTVREVFPIPQSIQNRGNSINAQSMAQYQNHQPTVPSRAQTANTTTQQRQNYFQTNEQTEQQENLMTEKRQPSNFKIVKRPMTAYKTAQIRSPKSKTAHSNYNQHNQNEDQAQSKLDQSSKVPFLNRTENASRLKERLKEERLKEQEKDEAMKELSAFENKNINEHKKNRYPNIQFEEAINFHKRFAEHLASKKASIKNANNASPGMIQTNRISSQKSNMQILHNASSASLAQQSQASAKKS